MFRRKKIPKIFIVSKVMSFLRCWYFQHLQHCQNTKNAPILNPVEIFSHFLGVNRLFFNSTSFWIHKYSHQMCFVILLSWAKTQNLNYWETADQMISVYIPLITSRGMINGGVYHLSGEHCWGKCARSRPVYIREVCVFLNICMTRYMNIS